MFMNIFRRASNLSLQTAKFQLHLRNFKCDTDKQDSLSQKTVDLSKVKGINNQQQIKKGKKILKNKSLIAAYSDSQIQSAIILKIHYKNDQSPNNKLFINFIQKLAQKILKQYEKESDKSLFEFKSEGQNDDLQKVKPLRIVSWLELLNAQSQFYFLSKALKQKIKISIQIKRQSKVSTSLISKIGKKSNHLGMSVNGNINQDIGKQAIVVLVGLHANQNQKESDSKELSKAGSDCARNIAAQILRLPKEQLSKLKNCYGIQLQSLLYELKQKNSQFNDKFMKQLYEVKQKTGREATFKIQEYYECQ